ncbi:unnamed protein product, partial [Prorocentrum cordatum]
ELNAELEAARVDFHWGDGVSFTDSAVPGRGSAAGVHYGAGGPDGRLVGSLVECGQLAAVSPDFDVCEVELSLNSGGLEGIRFSCSVDVWPRGVPALDSVLCTFAPLMPARVDELSAEADQVINLERAHRGFPLEGEAVRTPGAIAVEGMPVPAMGPALGAPRLSPTGGVWVVAEPLGGHDIGEESPLPAEAVGLGSRDLEEIDGGVAVLEQPGAVLLGAAVDGIDVKSLVDGELLLRLIPEHGEAATGNIESQGYDVSDYYLGIDERSGGAQTASSLWAHAATELSVEAVVLEEKRKASEARGAGVTVATAKADPSASSTHGLADGKKQQGIGVAAVSFPFLMFLVFSVLVPEAADGLNLLFGCDPQELMVPTQRDGVEAVGGCSCAHSAIRQHLFSTIASGTPDHVQSDHASLRELAGVNADYEMLARAVEPYDPTKVSLPEGQVSPVVLADVVSPELGRSLDLDNILADADVAGHRLRHEPVGSYTDVRIRGDEDVRLKFLRLSLPDVGEVFPRLLVLPTGWTWSFYVVQALHAELLRAAGFGQELIMSNAWPAPPSTDDPVALPYCDKPTVFGTSRERVNQRLRELIGVFEGKGFALHEISWATTSSDILGTAFDGVRRTVRARAKQAWTLRGALRHAARGGPISGKTLGRLLGHYVIEALSQRPALSVLRASYVFIRDCCWTPRPLWGSVCRELVACSSRAPLLSGNFGRPWSTSALASDASGSGWGVMEAGSDSKEVKEIGRWNERWRYERLPPSEWAPRRRALAAELDPLVDPVTSDAGPWDLDELGGAPSEFAWRPRAGFLEIPKAAILGRPWKRWGSIGNKEGSAAIKGMSLKLLDPCQHHKRHLVLVDNFGVALCFSRGRAASLGLLQLVRRLAALSIAAGAWVALRWVPSERNPADEPPRLFEKLREARARLYEVAAVGAELAAGGGLGACEPATVGARGLAAYQHFENMFREWRRHRGRTADNLDAIEARLLDHLKELLAANVKLKHAEKTGRGLLRSTLSAGVKSGICARLICDGARSTAIHIKA